MDTWQIVLAALLFLIVAAYLYSKYSYRYFSDRDVKFVEPPYPFLGSAIEVMRGKVNAHDFMRSSYEMYPQERYIGLFEALSPLIMLRDIQLIKQIGMRDLNSFHDHRLIVNDDSFFAKSLFGLQGNKWRHMRATLSPAFSAAKMKNMFMFIDECAKRLADHCEREIKTSPARTMEVEVRDLFSKYTLDTIASSAFGLSVDSVREPDNEFSVLGKRSVRFADGEMWKVVAMFLLPKAVVNFFNISIEDVKVKSFFGNLVRGTMRERERTGIVRPDMIHLLMEAKKGTLVHETTSKNARNEVSGFATVEESDIGKQRVKNAVWTDDDYTAQGFIFFIGGFDTTSGLLSFFFYELVRHPEVQRRIHAEIDEFEGKNGLALTYDDLGHFKYLDMAVSETLRMWPSVAAVDRVCAKEYTLPPASESSNKPYTLKPGQPIWIPVHAIHRDPQYYPNPDRFIPERFSDENKSSIKPEMYLPFGIGPRNCIGSRYALMVAKTVMIRILSKFEAFATEKTEIPLTIVPAPFGLDTKNGVWIGLRLRK